MMRELAKVTRIQNIEPIKGKDRIELATVGNYPVIVGKGEFSVGQLVVYVGYDTVLPVKPEFEFLRTRCWSNLYQGFRIRNMAMAGVFSSGIVFPLSILPAKGGWKDGDDVTYFIGVVKYDPEAKREEMSQKKTKWPPLVKWLMKFRIIRLLFLKPKMKRGSYPDTVVKSDETNIEKLYNKLIAYLPDELYYVTEKMEGQAGAWMLTGKKRTYRVFSHNTERNPKGEGNWEKVGRMYDMEGILRKQKQNLCIQGEVCGPNIQRNIYGFDTLKLFVYKITDVDTGIPFDYYEMMTFCLDNDLTFVPVVHAGAKLHDVLSMVLTDADGISVYGDNVLREGVVWRSLSDQNIGFKAKSRKYAVWFGKKDVTE